jgi:hypothetical protein
MNRPLVAIRLLHTIVWAFFAACVVLIPPAAVMGRLDVAGMLIGAVAVEVLVLAINRWRCPLTAVAARHTAERRDNFDIYLPLWLARYNKKIFGALFVAGMLLTLGRWLAVL